MPISYAIDHERRVMHEAWTDTVTAHVLGEYWRRLLADPEALAIRRTVVDLRGCRILFTGAELANLIDTIALPLLKGLDWKTAIVVDDPVQFGISRQYSVFAHQYSVDSIFNDPEAAIRWLLS